jgi:8-oxo-dGTP pyrophosphatase MutT (NUDIX family)
VVEVARAFNDVVCGVLVRADRVLLVHRNRARLWAPNCWDVPAGHIEQGESSLDALRREMREELGIKVTARDARLVGRMTGSNFDARVFVLDSWSGEPENCAPEEHDEVRWFSEEELPGLVLAQPDLLEFVLGELHRSRPAE